MFGQKLELIVRLCCVCKKMIALRVDKDDLRRHQLDGVFVQTLSSAAGAGRI